jgi:hypothetical protein
MSLLSKLLGSVSALGFAAASVPKPKRGGGVTIAPVYGLRPTPRHPERRKSLPKASPKRAAFRKRARALYLRRLARERAIGVHPKYRHGFKAPQIVVSEWLELAKQWNAAHPAKVAS